MALQMLHILSRAGAWWSGQPKSKTWEKREILGHSDGEHNPWERGEEIGSGLPLDYVR